MCKTHQLIYPVDCRHAAVRIRSYWRRLFQIREGNNNQVKLELLRHFFESPHVLGPTGCKWTKLGTEYSGTLSTTSTGKTCQAWTAQTPHKPNSEITNSNFPEGWMAAAENYCRNPNNATSGPWCYTMDPGTTWDYCNVTFCGQSSVGYAPIPSIWPNAIV